MADGAPVGLMCKGWRGRRGGAFEDEGELVCGLSSKVYRRQEGVTERVEEDEDLYEEFLCLDSFVVSPVFGDEDKLCKFFFFGTLALQRSIVFNVLFVLGRAVVVAEELENLATFEETMEGLYGRLRKGS